MSVLEDFKKYRDDFGLNQITSDGTKGDTSQNGALFSLEYVICLMKREDVSTEDKAAEIRRLQGVFTSLEKEYGLVARYPGSDEFNAIDNTIAHLVFDWLYNDLSQSRRIEGRGALVRCSGIDDTQDEIRNKKMYPLAFILNLGKVKNFWNINNADKFCFVGWLGRFPGFMGILDLVVKGRTSYFRAFILLVAQMLSCFDGRSNTSGTKLAYIVWELLKARGFVWEFGYNIWKYFFNKKYPGGPGEMYAIYYRNAEHPLAKYSGDLL